MERLRVLVQNQNQEATISDQRPKGPVGEILPPSKDGETSYRSESTQTLTNQGGALAMAVTEASKQVSAAVRQVGQTISKAEESISRNEDVTEKQVIEAQRIAERAVANAMNATAKRFENLQDHLAAEVKRGPNSSNTGDTTSTAAGEQAQSPSDRTV